MIGTAPAREGDGRRAPQSVRTGTALTERDLRGASPGAAGGGLRTAGRTEPPGANARNVPASRGGRRARGHAARPYATTHTRDACRTQSREQSTER